VTFVPAGHVVHVKVDLTQASAYDDLFPPSMFDEPSSSVRQSPGLPRSDAGGPADDAFEDVEEPNPFVGKTQVSDCHKIQWVTLLFDLTFAEPIR